MDDYNLVMDKRLVDYGEDDEGDQDDPRIASFNHDFLDTELKRPYYTPGIYNMSNEESTDNNLYCMSHCHSGLNRIA